MNARTNHAMRLSTHIDRETRKQVDNTANGKCDEAQRSRCRRPGLPGQGLWGLFALTVWLIGAPPRPAWAQAPCFSTCSTHPSVSGLTCQNGLANETGSALLVSTSHICACTASGTYQVMHASRFDFAMDVTHVCINTPLNFVSVVQIFDAVSNPNAPPTGTTPIWQTFNPAVANVGNNLIVNVAPTGAPLQLSGPFWLVVGYGGFPNSVSPTTVTQGIALRTGGKAMLRVNDNCNLCQQSPSCGFQIPASCQNWVDYDFAGASQYVGNAPRIRPLQFQSGPGGIAAPLPERHFDGTPTPPGGAYDPALDHGCVSHADCAIQGSGSNGNDHCITGADGISHCYVAKNRFITVEANPANNGVVHSLRVQIDFGNGVIRTVGFVEATPIGGVNTSAPHEIVPTLTPTPASDFEIEWNALYPRLHITGCAIVPGATYRVQAVPQGANPSVSCNYSAPVELYTSVNWGDVTGTALTAGVSSGPDGFVSISDVLDGVLTIGGTPSAPPLWFDVEGNGGDVNNITNLADVLQLLLAVTNAYPFAQPCTPGCLCP